MVVIGRTALQSALTDDRLRRSFSILPIPFLMEVSDEILY